VEVQTPIEVQVEVQQTIEVQVIVEAQRKVMEMERRESEAIVKRRRTILDKATLLDKGIKIPNLE
jgi:hypothetical protein